MAEDHVAGSDLGPLFTTIIADQFNRLRAGDRFFYLNESWNADELRLFRQGDTLAKVIAGEHGDHQPAGRRLQVHGVDRRDRVLGREQQRSRTRPSPTGTLRDHGPVEGLRRGCAGNDRDGPLGPLQLPSAQRCQRDGNYTVTLVVPDGYSQISKNPSTIMISRGGMNVGGVDFVLAPV